jgi:excisionase family DNA binding protein
MQRSQNRSQTFPKRAGLGGAHGDGGAARTPQKPPENRAERGLFRPPSLVLYYTTSHSAFWPPIASHLGSPSLVLYYTTWHSANRPPAAWHLGCADGRLTRVNLLQGTQLDVDRRFLTCSYFGARTAYRETSPATNSGTWQNKGNPARGSRTESGKATSPRWQGWPCPHFYHESTMSEVLSLHDALQLLTMPEAAQRLGISRRSLERLVAAGEFPRPLKVGGASRVLASDVSAYVSRLLAQRRVS